MNDHIRYDHKGQDPHQHESHSDGDDGPHHGVVALVRAEQPAQATSDPIWRPAYVHHGGWGKSLLHRSQVEVPTCRPLALLALLSQGEDRGLGRAVGRGVLQEQFALAALEADGQSPLHVCREFADDVLVVAQAGQVPAVGELGQLPTHGACQGLELGGGHVDASEALQAEGVPARQQLGGPEDVVVCAEAHSALSVLHIVCGGPPRDALSLFPVSSPGLLTPPSLPPLPLVPVPFSPPPSIPPLGVGAPRSPHFCRLLVLPLVLLAVLFSLVEFGFDVGGRPGTVALAPASLGSASLPVVAHVGGLMWEVESWLESDSVFQQEL